MRTEALTLSLAIHAAVLLLALLPSGGTPPTMPPLKVVATLLAPPPSQKRSTARTFHGVGREQIARAPIDTPGVRDALVIEIEPATFGNIFGAAQHWAAVLHAGIAYSDPGAVQVFFDRPADYSALSGSYQPGDAVWFAFPFAFRQRILERIHQFCVTSNVGPVAGRAVIAFTKNAPDYFEVLVVEAPKTTIARK